MFQYVNVQRMTEEEVEKKVKKRKVAKTETIYISHHFDIVFICICIQHSAFYLIIRPSAKLMFIRGKLVRQLERKITLENTISHERAHSAKEKAENKKNTTN